MGEDELVEVTQEDRVAAADLSEIIAGPTNGRDQIAECRAGKQDGAHLVQAFARHRLAAVEAERGKFNRLGRDANALFRERLGERTRPTWFAVNALQDAVEFCELYSPTAIRNQTHRDKRG